MLVVDSSLEQSRRFMITVQNISEISGCLDLGSIDVAVNDPPSHHLSTAVPKGITLRANLATPPPMPHGASDECPVRNSLAMRIPPQADCRSRDHYKIKQ
jgi:hypothetical protein